MKMVKRMFLAAVAAMFVGAQVSAIVTPQFKQAVDTVFADAGAASDEAMVGTLATMLRNQPTFGYLQDEVTYVLGAFLTHVDRLAKFAEQMRAIVDALSEKIVSIATAKGQYSDPFKDDINNKITELKQRINRLEGQQPQQPLNTRQQDSTTENPSAPSTVQAAASKQEQATQPSIVHQVVSNPTVVQSQVQPQPNIVQVAADNSAVVQSQPNIVQAAASKQEQATQPVQQATQQQQNQPKPASRTARSMAWSLGLFKNIWTFLKERATGAGDMGAFVN